MAHLLNTAIQNIFENRILIHCQCYKLCCSFTWEAYSRFCHDSAEKSLFRVASLWENVSTTRRSQELNRRKSKKLKHPPNWDGFVRKKFLWTKSRNDLGCKIQNWITFATPKSLLGLQVRPLATPGVRPCSRPECVATTKIHQKVDEGGVTVKT